MKLWLLLSLKAVTKHMRCSCYGCLISGTDKIRRSTGCCGKIVHQAELLSRHCIKSRMLMLINSCVSMLNNQSELDEERERERWNCTVPAYQ